MNIIIAADIGGSKSLVQARDADGSIIREVSGIGMGLAVDSQEALPVLRELILQAKGGDTVIAAAVNLGGRNREQIAAEAARALPGTPTVITRESEGNAAIALGKSVGAQIILLAGTGSIAVASDDTGVVIGGGWGANIGDDGSGYAIGLAAIRRSLAELDGSEPLSGLAMRMTGLIESPKIMGAAEYCALRDRVRGMLAPFERREIASKARLVAELADEGEPVSAAILADAGRSLGELVARTGAKLHTDNRLTVAITGGLVHAARHWQNAFEKTAASLLDIENFVYVPNGLIEGTFELAKNLLRGAK